MTEPTITATGLWESGKGLTPWRSNAELIARGVVPLGYLRLFDRVIDPTYGRGAWWKEWQPSFLTHHDITQDGVDFRKLPEDDASFDVAAFDPPYVCTGGRETSTIGEFNDRYGLKDAPRTPQALAEMNADGLAECRRVVKPGGLVLAKTANYVWSGKLFPGAYGVLETALSLGFTVVDWFVHTGTVRPQPPRSRKCDACGGVGSVAAAWYLAPAWARVDCVACSASGRVTSPQQHARQNVSYLYVLRRA